MYRAKANIHLGLDKKVARVSDNYLDHDHTHKANEKNHAEVAQPPLDGTETFIGIVQRGGTLRDSYLLTGSLFSALLPINVTHLGSRLQSLVTLLFRILGYYLFPLGLGILVNLFAGKPLVLLVLYPRLIGGLSLGHQLGPLFRR